MRKKLLSKTYLRDALKYEIKFFVGGEKCNIAVKKLIKLKEPFVISLPNIYFWHLLKSNKMKSSLCYQQKYLSVLNQGL